MFAARDRSVRVSARRGERSLGHLRSASDPASAGPKHRSRPRNRLSSNDVPSPSGRTHRRQQRGRTLAWRQAIKQLQPEHEKNSILREGLSSRRCAPPVPPDAPYLCYSRCERLRPSQDGRQGPSEGVSSCRERATPTCEDICSRAISTYTKACTLAPWRSARFTAANPCRA
jgi:hypothetical protein